MNIMGVKSGEVYGEGMPERAIAVYEIITDLMDQRIKNLRTNLETRLDENDRALVIQTTEFLRRLLELNHAHEKQLEDRQEFVKQAVYAADRANLEKWRDLVNATLAASAGRSSAYAVLAGSIIAIIGIAAGVITPFFAHSIR